jgi:hypothetical protein
METLHLFSRVKMFWLLSKVYKSDSFDDEPMDRVIQIAEHNDKGFRVGYETLEKEAWEIEKFSLCI